MEREVELRRINITSVFALTLLVCLTFGGLLGLGFGLMEGTVGAGVVAGVVWGAVLAFLSTFFAFLYNIFAVIFGGIKIKAKFGKQPNE